MVIWRGITEMVCKFVAFPLPFELASSIVSVHRVEATLPFGRRPGQHPQANILGKASLLLTRSTELQVDKNRELEKTQPGSCQETINMETLQGHP